LEGTVEEEKEKGGGKGGEPCFSTCAGCDLLLGGRERGGTWAWPLNLRRGKGREKKEEKGGGRQWKGIVLFSASEWSFGRKGGKIRVPKSGYPPRRRGKRGRERRHCLQYLFPMEALTRGKEKGKGGLSRSKGGRRERKEMFASFLDPLYLSSSREGNSWIQGGRERRKGGDLVNSHFLSKEGRQKDPPTPMRVFRITKRKKGRRGKGGRFESRWRSSFVHFLVSAGRGKGKQKAGNTRTRRKRERGEKKKSQVGSFLQLGSSKWKKGEGLKIAGLPGARERKRRKRRRGGKGERGSTTSPFSPASKSLGWNRKYEKNGGTGGGYREGGKRPYCLILNLRRGEMKRLKNHRDLG